MEIDVNILFPILTEMNEGDNFKGWKFINNNLDWADAEDGGGHYYYVLEEVATGKLWGGSYCDWDIDNTDWDWDNETMCEGGRIDLDTELVEVVAQETVITQYIKK